MKIQQMLATVLAALLMISNTFPVYAANADIPPEIAVPSQNDTLTSDDSAPEKKESMTSEDLLPSSDDTTKQEPPAAETEESGVTVVPNEAEEANMTTPDETEEAGMTVASDESEEADVIALDESDKTDETSMTALDESDKVDVTPPDEAPIFDARIEYTPQGYIVRGAFTEFPSNTILVQPLYSLDGEIWQNCQLTWTGIDLEQDLQMQICLYSTHEPLSGYLSGQLDSFYLKLRITLKNGITYDTKAAAIERNAPQPIPEELTPVASFVPSMLIRQWRPFKRYGQYQITVSADATPEEISALLPDTLPIEIQLYAGSDFVTNAIVDCPVTWKPLSAFRLTAGESVTIEDAAEEIVVPAKTLLKTETCILQLNEPLGMDNDEIRLVLNVVEESAEPTGVLADEVNGLQISFNLKPTGATAIRAYTLSESMPDWVELPDSLLPEEVNAPSSTANSPYTYLLKNTSEPYQSYLAAENAKEEPTPFLVGLKIEGGVFDGRQLILAWPDTYEYPDRLPELKGSGGNEGNAGSQNENDSTPEGQRPNLTQDPEQTQTGDKPDAREPGQTPELGDKQDVREPGQTLEPADEQDVGETGQTLELGDEQDDREPGQTPEPGDEQDDREPGQTLEPDDEPNVREPEQTQAPEDGQDTREQLRPLEYDTDGHTAGEEDSFMQVSIAETAPILIAATEKVASAPAVSVKTGSSAWEKTSDIQRRSLHWLLLPSSAAIFIGICVIIAAQKGTPGGMYGRVYGKIKCAINRLIHLK